jgi:hypothetical protein
MVLYIKLNHIISYRNIHNTIAGPRLGGETYCFGQVSAGHLERNWGEGEKERET